LRGPTGGEDTCQGGPTRQEGRMIAWADPCVKRPDPQSTPQKKVRKQECEMVLNIPKLTEQRFPVTRVSNSAVR